MVLAQYSSVVVAELVSRRGDSYGPAACSRDRGGVDRVDIALNAEGGKKLTAAIQLKTLYYTYRGN